MDVRSMRVNNKLEHRAQAGLREAGLSVLVASDDLGGVGVLQEPGRFTMGLNTPGPGSGEAEEGLVGGGGAGGAMAGLMK